MIMDFNFKGKRVLVIGGGKEATRKVEALLGQECGLDVVAEKFSEEILIWGEQNKATLWPERVVDGRILQRFPDLFLVMAATDDLNLNRTITEAARALGCMVYSSDDPEHSDFSLPSLIDLHGVVRVAVSTGGKSPLMAARLRRKIEPLLQSAIGAEDFGQIRLQEIIRRDLRKHISDGKKRKAFLESVANDAEIAALLRQERFTDALALANSRLADHA
jgi:precorrin-2 dehydrogenase/sirohydrochlorin ferrochelatase